MKVKSFDELFKAFGVKDMDELIRKSDPAKHLADISEAIEVMRKYIEDNYYKIHPRKLKLDDIISLRRNVKRWHGQVLGSDFKKNDYPFDKSSESDLSYYNREQSEINDLLDFFNSFFEAVSLDIERLQHAKRGKAGKPETLSDIFINKVSNDEAINTLQEVNNPVIDENMNYLLGKRQKSAFTAWIEVLETRGKVKKISAENWAALLNKEIKGLNLAKDGKTLRTPKNTVYRSTAYTKYRNAFLKEITS